MKGQGLGRALLASIIRYCRDRGTGVLFGEVLANNRAMLRLAASLGFEVSRVPQDLSVVKVTLNLQRGASAPRLSRAG
jgi:acetyltransferase